MLREKDGSQSIGPSDQLNLPKSLLQNFLEDRIQGWLSKNITEAESLDGTPETEQTSKN